MAANSSNGGSLYGGAASYRPRQGLSTRPVAASDEIQLRTDPMQADFDDEISGLRSQVRQLRNSAGRDYLKDVSVRHPEMRAPKVRDSLYWGKRKCQRISTKDSGLINAAFLA